jgi:hypothetical protein
VIVEWRFCRFGVRFRFRYTRIFVDPPFRKIYGTIGEGKGPQIKNYLWFGDI